MKMRCALAALALLTPSAFADQKVDEAVAKAEEQFQKGKAADALKTLQKVKDQNPTSPEAWLALGRMHDRQGKLDDAATALAKAVELAASAAPSVKGQAHAALARLDLKRGSGRDALTHAEEAVKADPNTTTFAILAEAQARVGNGTKALEASEKAVQAGATSALAHESRGAALLALHKNDEAAAAFRKALEADAKLADARVGLAQALIAQGKATEAVAEAKKATETNANSGEAFAVYGAALLAENPNNWNDAIAQAQQGAFLNPQSAVVQTIVGKIFEAAGNTTQAEASYRKAAEADPGYVPALSGLIHIQVRKGDLDGALAAARKLVEQAPRSGDAQLQLGRVLLRKKEFAEAVDALEKATETAPGAEAWALLGTAYQYTRRTPDAAAAYKKATELAPDNLDYKTTYGLLLGMTGDHQAGIAMLNKVIASPGYKKPDAYLNLGWVYRNMKPPKTEESVAAYKKALEIDPKNAQGALGMGWAYSYTRLWDQSIAAFKKAIELDPEVAGEANDGIAWCYFFKKDMPQARGYLEKARTAGRSDQKLKENIEKIEKLLAAGQRAEEEIAKAEGPKDKDEGPDLGTLVQNLKSNNVNVRRRAALDMVAAGAAGAPYLGYALVSDPEIVVREAAIKSLSAIGCAAKAAGPQLKEAAASRPPVNLNPTPAEAQLELRESDLRKAIAALLEKLQRC